MLRKRYWGQPPWARGYWVVSSGNVTDMWVEYIKTKLRPSLTTTSMSRELPPSPPHVRRRADRFGFKP
jgi:hypothetical protein